MATMALDTDWDLSLDAAGNLALISGGAELSQSVCNAVRVWRGEGWLDTNFGVPYELILGSNPPKSFITGYMSRAGFDVPGVESLEFDINLNTKTRVLSGEILINGVQNVVI